MQQRSRREELQLCNKNTVHKEDRLLQGKENHKSELLNKMQNMQLQTLILTGGSVRLQWEENEDLVQRITMKMLISDEHRQLILSLINTRRRSTTN